MAEFRDGEEPAGKWDVVNIVRQKVCHDWLSSDYGTGEKSVEHDQSNVHTVYSLDEAARMS